MFQLELHHLSSKSCFAKGCFPPAKDSYNKGDVITSSSEKNPLTSASSGILSQLEIIGEEKNVNQSNNRKYHSSLVRIQVSVSGILPQLEIIGE